MGLPSFPGVDCALRENASNMIPTANFESFMSRKLFRQFLLAMNGELCFGAGCAGPRLSSAHRNTVRSCIDCAVSSFIDKAQIPRIQRQLHMLRTACWDVNTSESAQR